MGSFSDLLENEIMDHIFENGAWTPGATVEVSLWVGDPTDTGVAGAEAAYTNYARAAITFDAAASRLINQTAQVDFPQCGATPQAGITHYGLHLPSAGAMLASGSLSSTVGVVNGNTPSIAAGQIDVSFSSTNMSTYLAEAILNFVFRNQAFTGPSIWCALMDATATVASTGATISEPVGQNYSRLDFADWSAAALGAVQNNTDMTFATPSGSWGTIVATALVDNATTGAGNMLWFDNAIVDQAVGNGDTVKFTAGDFDVAIS